MRKEVKRMSYENPSSVSKKRIRTMEILASITCLMFVAVFAGKYLIMPAVSKDYKATRNTVTWQAIEGYMVEGSYLDRNGSLIMGGSVPGEEAQADYPMNYSYSWLLGYYTVNSGRENRYGLRGSLYDYTMFMLDEHDTGATVRLTTENGLQNFAWSSILAGNEGSVTVIDNDTGAILCLASQSTIDYDVNDVDTLLMADVEGSQFRRGTYENDPPGSTFKVITSAAALQMQEEEDLPDSFFDYYDTGSYIAEGDGFEIRNYGDYAYGDINLETALNNSINCYFANLGNQVGQERIAKMAKNFLIGTDIEIPFLGTVSSVLDFGAGTPGDIAQVSFGQGNTEITPLQLAMIAQAIANNGVMMSPYLVESVKLGRLPLYTHILHKLNNCITTSVDEKLKAIMHTTAIGYGLDEAGYGMVYAKTGSAECPDGRVHTYIMGFTEDASFCISSNNSDISYTLYGAAQQLVAYLNNLYGRSGG